ncbi:CaiB/BaiF CoA transferase family protein [Noviherbaspirillum sedimenti]|uniref:CoA transferase n=1 Tax=Noviherbaspirillum sedimenti TaxID=2320865 RepID=A0A3A3G627_9BURK|nr:CoA transferase [Noviherbaspirillum sedimenti]RJG03274.1 CoA transferase [Noviherbaspirillum sedimenti]
MQKKGGPLSGIRILDAASLLAAPTAATLLSEYGAEVIKVEQPGTGDTMRRYPPFQDDVSLLWKVISRNKRSIALDLRKESGREVLRELASKCDVVTLNYRPETLAKWGLDFDDLVKCKKDIVVLHVTAYGRTGPYANRPGFARVAEAFSGLTYRTGFSDREPVQSGYPMLGDGVAGLYGAFSILLALRERDRTGEAQLIDLGLYEPLLRLMEDQIAAYGASGTITERIGNANPLIAPNGMFPTRDGRYVAIPASTEPLWRRLVALIGDESLYAYDSNVLRIANRTLIEGKVEEWTKQHDLLELVDICAEAGIACGPVYSAGEIARDPHIAARGSVISVDDAEVGGPVKMASPAGRYSGFEAEVNHLGPKLGEHTQEILSDLLGYSQEMIDALRRDGVL